MSAFSLKRFAWIVIFTSLISGCSAANLVQDVVTLPGRIVGLETSEEARLRDKRRQDQKQAAERLEMERDKRAQEAQALDMIARQYCYEPKRVSGNINMVRIPGCSPGSN